MHEVEDPRTGVLKGSVNAIIPLCGSRAEEIKNCATEDAGRKIPDLPGTST